MALGTSTIWQASTTGSDSNGGGFNPGNTSMATDGAATVATGTSPVFSSASYNFQARDVGAWLFIKSGTSWIPGWYQIASVASNRATLSAAIGEVQLYAGASVLNTAAGCATTASPSSATWTIDYSKQDAAGVAFTDLVIGATNTQFTSAGNPVGKNFVGNLLSVTGGAIFTVQIVEVSSVSGTTATCSSALGTASSTGGTGNLGGSFASIGKIASTYVASWNKAFVKYGTYQESATADTSGNNGLWLIGYNTYPGDNGAGGRPTIQLITNTGLTAFKASAANGVIQNFIIDCNNLGTSTGISANAGACIRNCKIINFTTAGVSLPNSVLVSIDNCELTGGNSGATGAIVIAITDSVSIRSCNIHDNVCPGISAGASSFSVENCVITNNTGSTSDGILSTGGSALFNITNNTIYGSGRDGIRLAGNSTNPLLLGQIKNNILSANGAYGLHSTSAVRADENYDGNFYYNNTSGPRNGVNDLTTQPSNGVAPYVNVLDVNLSGDPFTNAAGGNFTLNNTAGAAVRGAGTPGPIPGISQVGYPDGGALQSKASAGGGSILASSIIQAGGLA